MPDQPPVRVTLLIDHETAARYIHAGQRRQQDARLIMARDLQAVAESLPEPPRGTQPMRNLRDESRARSADGVSAHTAVMNQIPAKRPR